MTRCALGIIFSQDREQVLLIRRRDIPIWVLPGGGIDTGETPEEASIREVREETGLQVEPKCLVGEYTPINWFTDTVYVYECHIVGGALTAGCEAYEAAFKSLNELPRPLFPYHAEWITHASQRLSLPRREPMSWITFCKILAVYAFRPVIALRYLMARLGFSINS